MKIYIVTRNAFPFGMAATSRIICYAKALLSTGLECEVISYFRTEKPGKTPMNTEGIGIYEGIPFRYIGGTPIRGRNKIIRAIHDYMDKINTIKFLCRNMKKGDAILCYLREDPFAIKLQKFAYDNGYKIVRELCEYPYATGDITSDTTFKAEKYFKTVFKGFDGAICISQALYDVAKKYHPTGNYIKIPILIDEEKIEFDNISPIHTETPYIFHSGALLQQKDGIIDVLNAFADALPALPDGCKYYFTGELKNSRDKELINDTITKRNLSNNVVFLGFLSRIDLLRYMKGASLFIIYKNDNLQNRYCFATKLGEYLLSGNPVITTNVGEPKYYLTNKKNVFLVEPGNIQQLTDAIIYCLNNENNFSTGKEGQKIAKQHFCIRVQGSRLKEYFMNLNL